MDKKNSSDKVRIAITVIAVAAIVLALLGYFYRNSDAEPNRQTQEIR